MAFPKRIFPKRAQILSLKSFLFKFASLALILGGSALLFLANYPQWSWVKSSPSQTSESSSSADFAKPTKLYIPKLSKVLTISDGQTEGDRWKISETGVSYLVTSALPGQLGNSVIYGHNRQDILGKLSQVTTGDPIYVVLGDGNFVKYEVLETREVKPTQVEILTQTADSRLTIYTCSGFLDQARFVVVAKKADQIS